MALFAGLAYAVTQSSRSGADGVTRDKAKLYAAQMMQYGVDVEQAIARARVIDRVPEWGFDFSSDGSNATANGSCTSSQCKVFSDRGGTVAPLVVDSRFRTGSNGRASMRIVPVMQVGSDLDDVMLIFSNLTQDLCTEINRLAKVNADISVIETFGGSVTDYTGTITSIPASGGLIGDQVSAYIGQRTGCFQHNTAGYIFYHVILAR